MRWGQPCSPDETGGQGPVLLLGHPSEGISKTWAVWHVSSTLLQKLVHRGVPHAEIEHPAQWGGFSGLHCTVGCSRGNRWTDGLASCLLATREGLSFLGFIKAFGGLSGSRSLWSLDSPRQGLNVYNPRLVRKAAEKSTGI